MGEPKICFGLCVESTSALVKGGEAAIESESLICCPFCEKELTTKKRNTTKKSMCRGWINLRIFKRSKINEKTISFV